MLASRQDKIRDRIEAITIGNPITLSMYPKELKRFKAEYPSFTFEVLSTKKSKNKKMHLVRISL